MGKRASWAALCILLLQATAARAYQSERTYSLPAGTSLRVAMKYGQLRITGGYGPELRVKILVDERREPLDEIDRRLKVRFVPSARESLLEISGLKNPHVEVVVPAEVHLAAQLRAGELHIRGIHGNLRARMWAGDMSLDLPDRALYQFVRAHVRIGSVAHPFKGDSSGWMGRKFERAFSEGRYRLDASLGVGELHIVAPRSGAL